MISTDKAVNPSSIMGASKRLAELYVQHLNSVSDTACCMVRFGNVLGSACSVVPIWTKQLKHGGPITVTHADMTRYFMTIPEAAGLVLQAGMFSGTLHLNDPTTATTTPGCISGGGEVFLLDMGEPIRILDLARRFVRLQGFEPDTDVEIKITGTRPGEKLFEELAYTGAKIEVMATGSTIEQWVTVYKSQEESLIHRAGKIDNFLLRSFDDSGEFEGVLQLRGLFTFKAIQTPGGQIPLVRRKLARLLAATGHKSGSLRWRTYTTAYNSIPVEFLFEAPTEEIQAIVDTIHYVERAKELRTHVVSDRGHRKCLG